jgi:hypothetical protein
VSDPPPQRPSYDELAALAGEQATVITTLTAEVTTLRAEVAELRRRFGDGFDEQFQAAVVGRP